MQLYWSCKGKKCTLSRSCVEVNINMVITIEIILKLICLVVKILFLSFFKFLYQSLPLYFISYTVLLDKIRENKTCVYLTAISNCKVGECRWHNNRVVHTRGQKHREQPWRNCRTTFGKDHFTVISAMYHWLKPIVRPWQGFSCE